MDAADAQPVDAPEQCQKSGQRARTKPPGLVPGGGHAEGQSCAFLVPDAVIVARDRAKAIIAWAQIGVERLTPCSRILQFRDYESRQEGEGHLAAPKVCGRQ